MVRKERLLTIFMDVPIIVGIPDDVEIKLRDHFNKVIVPKLYIFNREVKEVKFEFITSGLLFGKVLGKKAYKVKVPQLAENSVLNSRIVTNRVVVNGKEYQVNWPEFYFANPDKVTVYIKQLLKKSRSGWKGKSFRSVFWSWDGSVTLRVIVKTRDGKVGYYDLLKVIFVYKGNTSAGLTWANEKRREYKWRIKAILSYIRAVYNNELAEAVSRGDIKYIINNVEDRKVRNFLLKNTEMIARLRREVNEVARLMNRTSGSRFLVIVEYNRMYNPILVKREPLIIKVRDEETGELKEIEIIDETYINEPVRFYTLVKEAAVKSEDRWFDEFGHQKFLIVNKEEKVEKLTGIKLEVEEFRDVIKKEFTPFGRKGKLNHKIVAQMIPPNEIHVDREEQANARWLWENVKVNRSKLFVTAYIGKDTRGKEWIVYAVTGVGNSSARLVVHNYDHRGEGKDRMLVHLNNNKKLVFAHLL